MITKECFKCGIVKNLDEFYRHQQMADNHVNKCKECYKKDVRKHRELNIEKIRAYDRKRGKTRHRREGNREREIEYRKQFPDKYKAKTMVNNAVRDGRLKKGKCVICGTTKRIEGHHEDYSKPLSVVWLCSKHHSAIHFNKEPFVK